MTPLEELQHEELTIAKQFAAVCDKNGLKYYMLGGTMLGAIRHKGFIPWDDDMDFGMLRGDFEKFIEVCETDLDKEKFYLTTDRKEKDYTFNFAKLRLNGTKIYEPFAGNGDMHLGVYIDIFPMDVVPDNRRKKWFQFHEFYVARNLLWVKLGYGANTDRSSEKSYKLARFCSHFFSVKFLKNWKHKCITKYANEPSEYVVTSDGSYGLKRETLRREWVETICDYPFEDRVYPGITDYDAYLTYLYGDYMEIPPEEKRKYHVRDVDFGIYGEE